MTWTCPKGHDVGPVFALADVRRDVGLGQQTCFCATCGKSYVLEPYAQNNVLGQLETRALSALVDGAAFVHRGTGYHLSVVGVHIDAVPFPPRSANVHFLAFQDGRGGSLPFELSVGFDTLRDADAMVARVQQGLALRLDAA